MSYFANQVAKVLIETPLGDPVVNNLGQQMAFIIFSPATAEYQRAESVKKRKAMDLARQFLSKKRMKDEDDRADVEFLISVTKEIQNMPEEFSGMTVEDVLTDGRLFYIKNQLLSAVSDGETFFDSKPVTSSTTPAASAG